MWNVQQPGGTERAYPANAVANPKDGGEAVASVVVILVSLLRLSHVLSVTWWVFIAPLMRSGQAYIAEAFSSSVATMLFLEMNVAGPYGDCVSAKLDEDPFLDLRICTL